MPISAELPPAVRQATSWKPSVVLAAVAFVITILSLQLWGHFRSQPAMAKTEPVTAIRRAMFARFSIGNGRIECAAARGSNHSLLENGPVYQRSSYCARSARASVPRFGGCSGQDRKNRLFRTQSIEVEKLRRALQVNVGESPAGGKCLRLTLSWPNSQEAAKLLALLGRRYAEQYRAGWNAGFRAGMRRGENGRRAGNSSFRRGDCRPRTFPDVPCLARSGGGGEYR